MPVKQEIAQALTGHWQVGLFNAPCQAPVSFCYGCCCTCCMAAQQRHQILDLVGEPYICCGGLFGECGPLGQPQDRNCAYVEACCCTGCAVGANRFIIQTRFDRENTACDDCILWTTCIVSWLACLLSICIDIPTEVDLCVDGMFQIVDGCMLAQHAVEIEYVKKHGYQTPAYVTAMLPPFQQNLVHQGRPPQQHKMSYPVGKKAFLQ
eukprot:TRINITY_DN7719_c0_g1_i1.p1 TRINITY_DN7719_c0_g1~~TRINITY_DN7719_c0_g1_i1.p1  ORF type:complete len:208 (-),score=32.68 TRINITY_DN7719_c0_g1_i1:266-889(-)